MNIETKAQKKAFMAIFEECGFTKNAAAFNIRAINYHEMLVDMLHAALEHGKFDPRVRKLLVQALRRAEGVK